MLNNYGVINDQAFQARRYLYEYVCGNHSRKEHHGWLGNQGRAFELYDKDATIFRSVVTKARVIDTKTGITLRQFGYREEVENEI